jgi:hypothetical protein
METTAGNTRSDAARNASESVIAWLTACFSPADSGTAGLPAGAPGTAADDLSAEAFSLKSKAAEPTAKTPARPAAENAWNLVSAFMFILSLFGGTEQLLRQRNCYRTQDFLRTAENRGSSCDGSRIGRLERLRNGSYAKSAPI